MQCPIVRPADIHAGAAAHRFEAFQHLHYSPEATVNATRLLGAEGQAALLLIGFQPQNVAEFCTFSAMWASTSSAPASTSGKGSSS